MAPRATTAAKADRDESRFASVTADHIIRKGSRPLPADSHAEPDDSTSDPTAKLFARKGEARPSPIGVQAKEFDRDSDGEALRQLRQELAAAQANLEQRETELAQIRSAGEQAQDSFRKAEQDWKTGEEIRLAAAQSEWQGQSSKALEEARAELQSVRAKGDEELRRLLEELTPLQAALKEHEAALAQLRASSEESQRYWARESEESLRKAENAWKVAEDTRFAAAQSEWQDKSTKAHEASRAEVRSAHDQHQEELRRVRDDLAASQAALKEQETALAQTRSSSEESLRKAEQAWKVAEDARLAIAQTDWQDKFTKAQATSGAEVRSARDQSQDELRRVRDDLAGIQASLKIREAELAQLRAKSEQAQENLARDVQEAVRKAEQAWKAAETTRLAAARAEWEEQSEHALAQANARCEAVESALARLRAQSSREGSVAANFGDSHVDELAALRAKRAEREAALEEEHPASEREGMRATLGSAISFGRSRAINAAAAHAREPRVQTDGAAIRDVLVATSLAILVLTIYPSVAPFLPERWQSTINAVASGIQPILGRSVPAPVTPVAPPPVVAVVPAPHMAVVARDVNVRATPSTDAEVVSTLRRGLKVALLETRGNWTLIRIGGEHDQSPALQGWAYTSFLKSEDGSEIKVAAGSE